MLLKVMSSSHLVSMLVPTAWGPGREPTNPSIFPTWWGGVFFYRLIPSSDMVNSESVVDIKPGYSGVRIGYQVKEFTQT